MRSFRFLVAGLCLTALCGAAQAQTATTQFIYVKANTSGSNDVYDVYLRILDPSNLSEGLATYAIRARYPFVSANQNLNDQATWDQNTLKALQGSGQTKGFWRATSGPSDIPNRPAVAAIDDPSTTTGPGYDVEIANTQYDSELPVTGIGKTAVFHSATGGNPSINLAAIPYLGTLTLPVAASGNYTITQDADLFAVGGSAHAGTTADPRIIVDEENLAVTAFFTSVGDVNLDGVVDALDIQPFVNLLTGGSAPFPGASDINRDRVVDALDIQPLVNILTGAGVNQADVAPLLSLAPEPGSLALLALGALSVLRRRSTPRLFQ